ncbi:MAG: hypothetical protein IAG13_20400 [Deltaproteobacteria bacterium]|nr:hypothetical protein [Nannocystaceae bacterium]
MHPSAALRFALPALVLAGGLGLTPTAEAKPNIIRKGGQWGVTLGGSACIPGQAKCNRDDVVDGGIGVDGKTRPSFGLGAELGYRLKPWMYVGAHYNFGLFDTDYEFNTPNTDTTYKRAYQNSIYGVFKPILPVWRFDFGLGMGPGFSRQVFKMANGDKDYSQGFSWVFSPTIDIWVARRVFVGIKADLLLNAHGKTCHQRGNNTDCVKDTASTDLAPVHQVIFGLHIGGTFL